MTRPNRAIYNDNWLNLGLPVFICINKAKLAILKVRVILPFVYEVWTIRIDQIKWVDNKSEVGLIKLTMHNKRIRVNFNDAMSGFYTCRRASSTQYSEYGGELVVHEEGQFDLSTRVSS